jgi:hypothetical protein
MTDITMWRRPPVADFGHVLSYHGTGAGHKSLADSSQSPAKTNKVYSQHTKHGTAEPFHFLHMSPMSDITMWRRPAVADFEHTMALWHWLQARANPKP